MNSLPQVLCLPQILGWTHPPCGSELAHEYGVSVADEVSGLTPSRASSLPHWFCIQNNSVWRLLNLYGSELPRQRRALICCDRFSRRFCVCRRFWVRLNPPVGVSLLTNTECQSPMRYQD